MPASASPCPPETRITGGVGFRDARCARPAAGRPGERVGQFGGDPYFPGGASRVGLGTGQFSRRGFSIRVVEATVGRSRLRTRVEATTASLRQPGPAVAWPACREFPRPARFLTLLVSSGRVCRGPLDYPTPPGVAQ